MSHKRADFAHAAEVIRGFSPLQPRIGLILGSGLGALAESVTEAVTIPYADIPGWPHASVSGHAGRLVLGHLEGQPALVMQGRAHFYEGHPMSSVVFPVRVMQALGIETLIVTNAAGGINPTYQAGDLMLINDHINLPGMVGLSPLMGQNDEALGVRFLDMTNAYDRDLRRQFREIAQREGIALHEGVYIGLTGPTYETPAEVRMLRLLGADAVGMSTVQEVVVARHAGMRVLGISAISNAGIDSIDSEQNVSHEEVLTAGLTIVPRLLTLLKTFVREV